MATKTPKLESLTLFDYTDRELLYIIQGAADTDGFAETPEIARRLGLTDKSGEPTTKGNSSVGGRLSWMRRFGWLEFDPAQSADQPTRWRITKTGEAIMSGKLNLSTERALDKADIGQQVLIMRNITKRGMIQGGRSKGMALSREFRHNAAQMNGKP